LAEEFAEFISILNNQKPEDQLGELKIVVGKMVDLIVKFVDNYTNELEIIYNKIISLETKRLLSETQKLERLTPPPNLNPSRVIGREKVRIAVLGELKDIFKKNKNGVGKKNVNNN
jgi:hypothetical protein